MRSFILCLKLEKSITQGGVHGREILFWITPHLVIKNATAMSSAESIPLNHGSIDGFTINRLSKNLSIIRALVRYQVNT